MRIGEYWRWSALLMAASGFALPATAGTCLVPGTHESIQAAIDDPDCSTVQLDRNHYQENLLVPRSVEIVAPGSESAVISGQIQVRGAQTAVRLENLHVLTLCDAQALMISDAAQLEAFELEVVRDCPASVIFRNGFE